MFAPRIAELLRERGVDCRSVAEEPALRALDDADVLQVAVGDGRVLVTENVGDFEVLRRERVADGEPIPMIILTSHRAFPRNRRFVGRIVDALALAAGERPFDSSGGVHWLRPDRS